jgi:N-acetylmuramoyl-L-alanine amidase
MPPELQSRVNETAAAPSKPGLQYADLNDLAPPSATSSPKVELAASSSRPSNGTVYLDIGHCTSGDKGGTGKHDTGFQSEDYNECQVNTAVGKNLIKELTGAGLRVVPTWNPNSPPALIPKPEDLQRRNNKVNKDVALNCDDSIYVSIHHDNDPTKKSGQCVYIADPKFNEALPLAQSIQRNAWRVRERENAPLCINSDKVTGNGKLVGLRGVNAIGVLVEGANVANAEDKGFMNNPKFHEYEAKKIAQGVIQYFQLKPGVQRPTASCRRSF